MVQAGFEARSTVFLSHIATNMIDGLIKKLVSVWLELLAIPHKALCMKH